MYIIRREEKGSEYLTGFWEEKGRRRKRAEHLSSFGALDNGTLLEVA